MARSRIAGANELMGAEPIGRRELLRLLTGGAGASLALAACSATPIQSLAGRTSSSAQPTAAPTAPATAVATPTPVPPTATPVPTNTPNSAAKAFLTAWGAQDFKTMYGLLSEEAKATISQDQFTKRYAAIWDEASIIALKAQLQTPEDPHNAVQRFHVSMQTALVGTIEQDNTMALIQEGNRWLVQWLPSLLFKELAGDNLIHMFPQSTPRGDVLDRNGKKLATQTTYSSLGLVPEKMQDAPAALGIISKALGYPLDKLQTLYTNAKAHPSWLQPVRVVPPDKLDAVRLAVKDQPGVVFNDVSLRGYPLKDLAAQSVGYLGEISADELNTKWQEGYLAGDWLGRTGIERWGEPLLSGKRGGKLAVVSTGGAVQSVIAQRDPVPAQSIVLTLDSELQQAAQKELGTLIGSVVVMRVSDGALLALASSPTFDLNPFIMGLTPDQAQALFQNPDQPLTNRPTLGVYPPGSTFKTVTMSAVLAHGVYGPGSTFDCTGVWNGLGIPMHCWKTPGHGVISLSEGLAQSCDVVFYTCGHTLDGSGHNVFPDLVKGFGVGQTTGLVGLEEAAGLLPTPAWKQQTQHEPWYPGDPVNMAIGQGFLLVTPVQMVNWIAAIANGGTLWTPRVVDKVVAATGEVTQPAPPKSRGTLPVPADQLAAVRAAMRQTIGETKDWLGTGSWAFRDFPIPVAGKTGTAQSGQRNPHAWFASFGPYDKPEIAVVAMIEHAAGEGADIAAPIARTMYETYYKTPWAAHVAKEHQYCLSDELLCTLWPKVPSSSQGITYQAN